MKMQITVAGHSKAMLYRTIEYILAELWLSREYVAMATQAVKDCARDHRGGLTVTLEENGSAVFETAGEFVELVVRTTGKSKRELLRENVWAMVQNGKRQRQVINGVEQGNVAFVSLGLAANEMRRAKRESRSDTAQAMAAHGKNVQR